MDEELYHYGIKGMKWGVRRYQNKDGSLTPAGKKRESRLERAARKQREDADELYKAGYKQEAKAVRDVARKTAMKAERQNIKKSRKAASKNRSLMSDAELDRRIKRLEKEKRLRELTESEVSSGKSYAKKAMDRYGNQVAAAVVAGTTAVTVKEVVKPAVKRALGG